METEKRETVSWKLSILKHLPKNDVFQCKFPGCGNVYRSYNSFVRHRKVHDGIKYTCSKCLASFDTKNYLGQHLRRNKICSSSVEALAMELSHSASAAAASAVLPGMESKETSTDNGQNKFVCQYEGCSKFFWNAKYLQRHNKIHDGVKYPCLKCNRTFKKISAHRKVCLSAEEMCMFRLNSKPHICENCLKTFRSKAGLKNHYCVREDECESDFGEVTDPLELSPDNLGSSNEVQEVLSPPNNVASKTDEEVSNLPALIAEFMECNVSPEDIFVTKVSCEEKEEEEKMDVDEKLREEEEERPIIIEPLKELLKCCIEYNERLTSALNFFMK